MTITAAKATGKVEKYRMVGWPFSSSMLFASRGGVLPVRDPVPPINEPIAIGRYMFLRVILPLEARATAVTKGIYTATSAEFVVNKERKAADRYTNSRKRFSERPARRERSRSDFAAMPESNTELTMISIPSVSMTAVLPKQANASLKDRTPVTTIAIIPSVVVSATGCLSVRYRINMPRTINRVAIC